MADRSDGFFAYNSQLVSSFYNQILLMNGAEFTPQDAFTLYHIIQEDGPKRSGGLIAPALPALGHALAGGLASATAKAAIYPIDTIVTRMQVQKQFKGDGETPSAATNAAAEYKSPIDAASKIYKNEGGLKAFYSGVSSDMVKHVADAFLFFLAYNSIRDGMLKRQGGKQLPVVKELSVGVMAGALSKAVTQPISNIVVRQQTAALVAARDPGSPDSPSATVKEIAKQIRAEKGIAGFWSGYSLQLILTLNPAITFAVDNLLQSAVPKKQRGNPTPPLTFLIAALSKVVATSITYPVMLAKSRAQASRGSSNVDPHEHKIITADGDKKAQAKRAMQRIVKLLEGQTAIYYALKIYQQEGLAGLYSGWDGEVVKGFLQHGLTMVLKESVHGGVIQLYYILLRATKKWDGELVKAQERATAVAGNATESIQNAASETLIAAKNAVGQ